MKALLKFKAWDSEKKEMITQFSLNPTSPDWAGFPIESPKWIYDMQEKIRVKAGNRLSFETDIDSFVANLMTSDYTLTDWSNYYGIQNYVILQFSGISDKNGAEVYTDDILSDGKKKFRVYQVAGGFVIKAYAWADNRKDLIPSDQLIFMALSDPQTNGYIRQSCEVIGNANSNTDLL